MCVPRSLCAQSRILTGPAQRDLVERKGSNFFTSAEKEAEQAKRKTSSWFGSAKDDAEQKAEEAKAKGGSLFGAAKNTAEEARDQTAAAGRDAGNKSSSWWSSTKVRSPSFSLVATR